MPGARPPRLATKRLLLTLSHAMEHGFDTPQPATPQPATPPHGDGALVDGLVIGLFQRREYFDHEAERYAELGRRGCTVIVGFAGPPASVPAGVHAVSFAVDDPLAREWAVILLRGAFGNALVAHDEQALVERESTLQHSRLFGARWTFTREQATAEAESLLRMLAPRLPAPVVAAAWKAVSASRAQPVTDVEAHLSAAAEHLVDFLDDGRRVARAPLDTQSLNERDQLTGLHNRYFLERFLGIHPDDPVDLTVMLVGIDDLDGVNDTLGRRAGDEVVKAVARALDAGRRTGDVVVRWGGDEFLVLCAGLSPGRALEHAERLTDGVRQALADKDWGPVPLSASIGVCVTTRPILPLAALGDALAAVQKTRPGHAGLSGQPLTTG